MNISKIKFFTQMVFLGIVFLFLAGSKSKIAKGESDSVIFFGHYGWFIELSLHDLTVLNWGQFPRTKNAPKLGPLYRPDYSPKNPDYWQPFSGAFNRSTSRIFIVYAKEVEGMQESFRGHVFVFDNKTFKLIKVLLFDGGTIPDVTPSSGKEVLFQYQRYPFDEKGKRTSFFEEGKSIFFIDIINAENFEKIKSYQEPFNLDLVFQDRVLYFLPGDYFDSEKNAIYGENYIIRLNESPVVRESVDLRKNKPEDKKFNNYRLSAVDQVMGKTLVLMWEPSANVQEDDQELFWVFDLKFGKRISPYIQTTIGRVFFINGGKTIIHMPAKFEEGKVTLYRTGQIQIFEVKSGKMVREIKNSLLGSSKRSDLKRLCTPQVGNYIFYSDKSDPYKPKLLALNIHDGVFEEIKSGFDPVNQFPCLVLDR